MTYLCITHKVDNACIKDEPYPHSQVSVRIYCSWQNKRRMTKGKTEGPKTWSWNSSGMAYI